VALASVALGYAVGRFFLEGLRDDARPSWLGLSESRWLALLTGAPALYFLSGDRVPRPDGRWLALAVGALALVVLIVARRRWLSVSWSLEGDVRDALCKLGRDFKRLVPGAAPEVHVVAALRVVGSVVELADGPRLVLSLSRDGAPLTRAEADIVFDALCEGAGASLVDAELHPPARGLHVASLPLDEHRAVDLPARPERPVPATTRVDRTG
jgi:hypothetical protein